MNDSLRRVVRTFLQLVAGGALTALTLQLARDVPVAYAPYVMLVYTLIVSFAQNYLESAGFIKPFLRNPQAATAPSEPPTPPPPPAPPAYPDDPNKRPV